MSIDAANDEFFSSLVRDIKNYDGKDPLRPWTEGIKKMESTLPRDVLKEKLPRFLQKCIQTFQSDRRYCNDSRYVGVWIQLMDFVENPKSLLRMMEKNGIGMKRASFYMAYALFYEKRKMFEAAEKYFYLGAKNLAEPAAELRKSYEKFLCRLELYKKRKHKLQETQVKVVSTGINPLLSDSDIGRKKPPGLDDAEHDVLVATMCHQELQNNCSNVPGSLRFTQKNYTGSPKDKKKHNNSINRQCSVSSDDTVVVKFVGSAIVGKSEAEDACHHGLVDPTINMKEAMNAISNMFKEPLEVGPKATKKSSQRQSKDTEAFDVLVDDNIVDCCQTLPKGQMGNKTQKPSVGTFKILADDDDEEPDDSILLQQTVGDSKLQPLHSSACSKLNNIHSANCEGPPVCSMEEVRPIDDTIIRRFMGSTVFNEPEVENACHHGLVDPTVNMKEAMNDINSMFGEPINFLRPTRKNRQTCFPRQKDASHGRGFSILADDFSEGQTKVQSSRRTSSQKSYQADFPCQKEVSQGFLILADYDAKGQSHVQSSTASLKKSCAENDLFEPTIFTKEAMDEINSLFGKPLDF